MHRTLLFAVLLSLGTLPSAEAARGGNGNGNGGGGGGGGGDGLVSAPTDFDILYCWGMSTTDPACPVVETVLYEDGTIEAVWITFGDFYSEPTSAWGTWSTKKKDKELKIEWDGGTVYEGTRYADGCYAGTMEATDGLAGAWDGCLL